MKKFLADLKCVHSDIKVAVPHNKLNSKRATVVREDDGWKPTENSHPVVRTHPCQGKNAFLSIIPIPFDLKAGQRKSLCLC